MTVSAPVKTRIEGLDVLRGFALFGIAVVNVAQIFRPVVIANAPVVMVPGEHAASAWFVLEFLFMDKFFTLFSMMFGMGFALQFKRADGDLFPIYKKRLMLLAGFGLINAILLYWADVLLIYAISGFLLLLCRNMSAARMMRFGAGLLLMITFVQFVGSSGSVRLNLILPVLLSIPLIVYLCRNMKPGAFIGVWVLMFVAVIGLQQFTAETKVSEGDLAKMQALATEIANPGDQVTLNGVTHARPLSHQAMVDGLTGGPRDLTLAESLAYTEGPYANILQTRGTLLILLTFEALTFFHWRVWAIFLIAAGLVKWGFLDSRKRAFRARGALLGFAAGLPVSALATWLKWNAFHQSTELTALGEPLHQLASFLLAFAMSCAVLNLAESAYLIRIRKLLAAAGKVALTNYLGQSAVLGFFAAYYGFGLYGRCSKWVEIGLAAAVFLALAFASMLWLKIFRMGPLEWIWRCGTYGKLLPLKRS